MRPNGNFLFKNGGNCSFSIQMPVSFILRIEYYHPARAYQFRARCPDDYFLPCFLYLECNVIEVCGLVNILDFSISNCRLAARAEIVYARILVDQSLIPQINEGFLR